jgi:hypothetical protein
LIKATPGRIGFSHNHVFGTDTLLIRTKDMVGARSAQWLLLARSGIKTRQLDLR